MPLVTRTSTQGNFFKEDEEPTNWQNADLWADTNVSPRTLFINNDGTALALGVGAVSDSDSDIDAEGATAGGIQRRFEVIGDTSGAFVVKLSITLTPTLANNIVIITGTACIGTTVSALRGARIQESGAEVGSSTFSETSAAASWRNMQTVAVLTDVSVAAHTFDIAVIANHAATEAAGYSITGDVIE